MLLFAGRDTLNVFMLKSKHRYHVSNNLKQVIGVSYDGYYVYWTDIASKTESILRARKDGSGKEVSFG